MKKHIFIALVCACLILITPFTVVAQENKISSNLTEKPDMEGLVSKIRTRINEKLEKYESKPKLANFWDIILYLLELFGKIVKLVYTVVFYIVVLHLAILLFLYILYMYFIL